MAQRDRRESRENGPERVLRCGMVADDEKKENKSGAGEGNKRFMERRKGEGMLRTTRKKEGKEER